MNPTTNYPTLADVLNEYVAQARRPSTSVLRDWIERYPQFQHELIDFSTAWALEATLPPIEEVNEADDRRLVGHAMSHVQNVLFDQDRRSAELSTTMTIAGVLDAARSVGMDAKQLASACEIDVPLIVKLDQRKIRGPIPQRLIACLAEVLRCAESALLAYLASAPRLAGAHLARVKPAATGQQSFAEAVKASSLSDAAKRRWLAEAVARNEER